jgi:hypothetical protein
MTNDKASGVRVYIWDDGLVLDELVVTQFMDRPHNGEYGTAFTDTQLKNLIAKAFEEGPKSIGWRDDQLERVDKIAADFLKTLGIE